MGKSTLALNIAVNCGDYGKRAAYYSLEMSSEELINKIISKKNKIELKRIQRGQIDPDELKRIKKDFEKTEKRLWINDSPTLSTQELRRSCVRLKAKEKIDLVIIDYLQFMHTDGIKPGQNREQEISMISRSLKNLAKELDVPVIALSQLSRAVESRGGNMRPRLSDLRESGAIENDADIVIFTFRPEYYKIEDPISNGKTYPSSGLAIIDIAKGRNIKTQEILCNFSGKYSSFTDYNEDFLPDEAPQIFQEQEEKNPW